MSKTTVATFGGAWSNHIIATAFAAREAGIKSVGIIRGEKPSALSLTLQQASLLGMELIYVTREDYRDKEALIKKHANENYYWINEGGYGFLGAKGAADILTTIDASQYTHIIASVGTGTMLAGVTMAAKPKQQVIGISSMKGNLKLKEDVEKLLPCDKLNSFTILHDYHFGGYAKHPPQLIDFIHTTQRNHNLPLDIVYTGKTFFAIKDLNEKSFFKRGSRVLMIHSGGLQGNAGYVQNS
jgi:1-aminocyclopropane-1-carboxylate deaminase